MGSPDFIMHSKFIINSHRYVLTRQPDRPARGPAHRQGGHRRVNHPHRRLANIVETSRQRRPHRRSPSNPRARLAALRHAPVGVGPALELVAGLRKGDLVPQ